MFAGKSPELGQVTGRMGLDPSRKAPNEMTLFKVSGESFTEIPPTTYKSEGLYEHSDLQRLLRNQFAVVDPT